jgi:hypothetical protein
MNRAITLVTGLLLLLAPASLLAQKRRARPDVQGVVTDQSDAPVVGAVVNSRTPRRSGPLLHHQGGRRVPLLDLNTDTDYKIKADFRRFQRNQNAELLRFAQASTINLKLNK